MDAPIPWQQFMKLPLREAGDTGDGQINQQTIAAIAARKAVLTGGYTSGAVMSNDRAGPLAPLAYGASE